MPRIDTKQSYDLEEKFEQLEEKIIVLTKKAAKNVVTLPIINQLVRAGTSIGANYTCPVRNFLCITTMSYKV